MILEVSESHEVVIGNNCGWKPNGTYFGFEQEYQCEHDGQVATLRFLVP
jgi:hypothetical protein